MQSAGDDSFSLTLALLVETINKQRFSYPLHAVIIIIIIINMFSLLLLLLRIFICDAFD